jgi:hypothetical protein
VLIECTKEEQRRVVPFGTGGRRSEEPVEFTGEPRSRMAITQDISQKVSVGMSGSIEMWARKHYCL